MDRRDLADDGGILRGLCVTSVCAANPARSTGVALFADGPALAQLWLFWIAPLLGAAVGGLIWKMLLADD